MPGWRLELAAGTVPATTAGMNKSIVLLTILAAITPACDADPAVTVTAAEFASGLFATSCAKAAECCTVQELSDQFFSEPLVVDAASCESELAPLAQVAAEIIAHSVDAGRAEWDGEAANDCLTAMAEMTCDEYATRTTILGLLDTSGMECAAVRGRVASGGDCQADLECVSGYCAGLSSGGRGNCRSMPATGDACPRGLCAEGTHCDESGDSPICRERLPLGVTCDYGEQCQSNSCSIGLLDEPRVCIAPTVCNGNPDDTPPSGACTFSAGDQSVGCEYTNGIWDCVCTEAGDQHTCSIANDDPGFDPCWDDDCCGF